jgi:hypothetical protein
MYKRRLGRDQLDRSATISEAHMRKPLMSGHFTGSALTVSISVKTQKMRGAELRGVLKSELAGWSFYEDATKTDDRPRSDALEDVPAAHPYHATILADIRRDPSRSNCRRADEASRPYRRYSAIRRPIPRCLEHHPRTLNAPHHIIGDCRTWTHWAAEENSGEISGSWVDRQNFQD